ncbi:hypothetical protein DFQ14_104203 [Halopolyspora algeriensis]|uniref:Uncharacterized protein n=1 Tax=Halopolyspora algeriensis TaxID=1500506 RepID=A0A368VYF9_9ACTN|nr:DUF6480 family protein [Halopolyspora algeriensis]RCW44614.1 hypothetical protein DFQ14_104203 [Halopolyspora algeriensis]TQM55975.1 hypothetical protein FHU43_0753 [Halopolyspora algeriensis]
MSARDPQEPDNQDSQHPDPEETPGLEPGGSVPPGETPPESASATDSVSHPQRAEARPMKWLWLIGIALIAVLVALFFVMLAVGMLT